MSAFHSTRITQEAGRSHCYSIPTYAHIHQVYTRTYKHACNRLNSAISVLSETVSEENAEGSRLSCLLNRPLFNSAGSFDPHPRCVRVTSLNWYVFHSSGTRQCFVINNHVKNGVIYPKNTISFDIFLYILAQISKPPPSVCGISQAS